MTDTPPDKLDPEIEALLVRWTWDPTDLEPGELARLEGDPSARERMQGLRESESVLDVYAGSTASDEAREAFRSGIEADTDVSGHKAFQADLEALRQNNPYRQGGPATTPAGVASGTWLRRFLPVAAAAAAVTLLSLWIGGVFDSVRPDVPLGDDEIEATFDSDAGAIRWEGSPPNEGTIRIELTRQGVTIPRDFYDDDPEWTTRSHSLDPTQFAGAFSFEVQFKTLRGIVKQRSRRQSVDWRQ